MNFVAEFLKAGLNKYVILFVFDLTFLYSYRNNFMDNFDSKMIIVWTWK